MAEVVNGDSGWLRLRYWDWRVGVLVFIGGLVGTIAAILLQPDEFRSTAVLSLEPRADRVVSGATVTLLSPRYVAFATSDFLANRTAEILGVPPAQVRGTIGSSIPPESITQRVSARASDAESARLKAAVVANEVLEEAKTDSLLRARLVSPATTPTAPARASRRGLFVSGAIASALAAAAAAYLVGSARQNRSRRDPSDEQDPSDRASRDGGVGTPEHADTTS